LIFAKSALSNAPSSVGDFEDWAIAEIFHASS